MGTISLFIFYLLFGCIGAFAFYCSKLALKKVLGHISEKQWFSAFTFYGLYLAACVISTVMTALMLSEIVILLTEIHVSPDNYIAVLGGIMVITIIVAIAISYKRVMQTIKG